MLTPEQNCRIETICEAFERAWISGRIPAIENMLADVSETARPELLHKLVERDIHCRLRSGLTPDLAMYLSRWPQLDRQSLDVWARGTDIPAYPSQVTPSGVPPTEACSVQEFLRRLLNSGLIQEPQQNHIRTVSEGYSRTDALAERFVQDHVLTPWQVRVLISQSSEPLVLGEYVLQEIVGSGGMGTVYRAIHRRMKRPAAIKILRRDLAHSDDLARRFLREVEVAARLCHPNIVTAYDAGEQKGISFLVSEFVEGQNLGELVREYGPLSLPLATDVICQAARALDYAHQQGIIHRDIKPSNLLLDDAGNVKLLDVGLARIHPDENAAAPESDLTTSGMIMGTFDYMSPEQAVDARQADARSDTYSLGCTLFFLMTGRAPYGRGTAIERLLAHREQPVPSLLDFSSEVPPALDRFLSRLMAKKPEERIGSMAECLRELESLQNAGLPDIILSPRPAEDAGQILPQTVLRPESTSISATTPASAPSQDVEHSDLDVATVIGPVEHSTFSLSMPAVVERHENAGSIHRGRSSSPSFVAWVLIPGVAALVAAGFLLRDPPVTEWNTGPDASVAVPAVRPEMESLTDFSEEAVQEYQAKWAAALGVDSEQSVGEVVFVLIPPGTFLSDAGDGAREIQIEQEFWLSEVEITVGQYAAFVKAIGNFQTIAERTGKGWGKQGDKWVQAPEYNWKNVGENFVNENVPACNIAYPDAIAFCEWMSSVSGRRIQLPEEHQWEYACRCGRRGAWSFGDDRGLLEQYGWVIQNSSDEVHPVRSLLPNAWGLFDMHGNEWEWCFERDAIAPDFPGMGTLRGRSFNSSILQTQSSSVLRSNLQEPGRGAFRVLMER